MVSVKMKSQCELCLQNNKLFCYSQLRLPNDERSARAPKEKMWLHRDHERQTIKSRLDAFWEEKHSKKEALRIKNKQKMGS